MFLDEKPINDKLDDRLGRFSFAGNLSKAVIDWKGQDSLVIALNGKWGSGKTSIINIFKQELQKSTDPNKPTVIEFNPWVFSGEDGLLEHFFNEIATELKIKGDSKKDILLANTLRLYSRLLGLVPSRSSIDKIIQNVLIVIGILGISSGQILQWVHLDVGNVKNYLIIFGLIALLFSLAASAIEKFADFLEKRGSIGQKTVLDFKNEIKDVLRERRNKILIILDDIDRLTPEEIKIVFKLIKINSDFPNVVFLLSFDRNVIINALELQPGINGQDYIEKIVQVGFDIPLVKQGKIVQIFLEALNTVLAELPKSADQLFDQTYWGNVYYSGLKNFFKNIRDVKRFINSLSFNFALVFKEESMEVNPIDFIAVEAIRVFAPDFYTFMGNNANLFTSIDRDTGNPQGGVRKAEIENELNKLPEPLRENVKKLLMRIFPQVDGVFRLGYSSHGYDWIKVWNQQLRVCSPNFFDAYFTFIPGGDEAEISQFEMDRILNSIADQIKFESILREFIKSERIRKVLEKLQDYTEDTKKIPHAMYLNVIQTLFNISDDLPVDRNGMFDFGADTQCSRIIYQLLKQIPEKEKNFTLLRGAIQKSTGLYGPIYNISIQTEKAEESNYDSKLLPDGKIEELKLIGSAKINEFKDSGKLKSNRKLLSILYKWKHWSTDGSCKDFIDEMIATDDGLIDFLKLFVSVSFSHTFGDHVGTKISEYNLKSLMDFVDLKEISSRIQILKDEEAEIYHDNIELIDMFLTKNKEAELPKMNEQP